MPCQKSHIWFWFWWHVSSLVCYEILRIHIYSISRICNNAGVTSNSIASPLTMKSLFLFPSLFQVLLASSANVDIFGGHCKNWQYNYMTSMIFVSIKVKHENLCRKPQRPKLPLRKASCPLNCEPGFPPCWHPAEHVLPALLFWLPAQRKTTTNSTVCKTKKQAS